jgi:PAS domain S-box-containing protein
MKSSDKKNHASDRVGLEEEISNLKRELEIQGRVAFAAGLFQGDITIRTMLESLAEAVVIIDDTGTIVLANHQTEELFGYNKEEILGCQLSRLIPNRHQNSHDSHVKKYFKKPRIRPMGIGRELKALHKQGNEFPVEVSLSHLETTGGQLAMAFVTDITLRKEAENSLKSRNEELDAFAHTVAHDLRGSLTPLLGYCELLTTPDVQLDNQQIQGALNGVCRVSHKMAAIIDELLLLSSVRKEDVRVDVLDMRPIVCNVVKRLKEEHKDISFDVSIAENLPKSYGYAPWIEEVWCNYISNAIKYGGSPATIEIGGELKKDGFSCFWVKDNGQGVSDDELQHLFTPYLPRKNDSSSHGLGLSIVKRIVEKLNGDVSVERIPGTGTRFCFTLPATDKA